MARITGQAVVLREYKRRDARKYFRWLRSMWMSLTPVRQQFLTSRYLSSDDPATSHCVIEIDVTDVVLLTSPT
jgi:hypothetical protein